jgi:hypothetical protein
MLDHVQRRGFLVKPAGEGAVPAAVAFPHVDLDERAGQLLLLPRRGGFACTQADDHVLPARGLAGMERDVLDDSVALVEDAEDGDALRHWRDIGLIDARTRLLRGALIRLVGAAVARRQRNADQQRYGEFPHAYSGIHGS